MPNLTSLPAFFVPTFAGEATSPEMAESRYTAVKRSAHRTIGWQPSERRIFRIGYIQNGQKQIAEVGSRDNPVGEVCVAILETPECYLLYTENRGVARGMPVLIGTPHAVVDFGN